MAKPSTVREAPRSRASAAWEAVLFCARPRNLRRTVKIAVIVGFILTGINQSAAFTSGDVTAGTWVRSGLNFVVPFLVSNAGLLSGRG